MKKTFLHILGRGKEKPVRLCHKTPPDMAHRAMRPRYVKETKKDTENSKGWQNRTGRGCAGTNNTGVTRTPNNTLKGIRNPIPQDLNNPLKGIRYLVQNGTRSHWPRGLSIPT